MSAEDRLRKRCESLFIQFTSKKNNLPIKFRNLLERDRIYFRRARIGALKSWIRRINLAVPEISKKNKNEDIRRWFPPKQRNKVENDDSSLDSDDTANWVRMYPDEDPNYDTWDLINNWDEQNKEHEHIIRIPSIPWQTGTSTKKFFSIDSKRRIRGLRCHSNGYIIIST